MVSCYNPKQCQIEFEPNQFNVDVDQIQLNARPVEVHVEQIELRTSKLKMTCEIIKSLLDNQISFEVN